jgi:hypothetical protein
MLVLRLFTDYFAWHYSAAFGRIFSVWKNFVWYVGHILSLPLLVRTLFAPWKRITESKGRGFDVEQFFAAILVNFVSRIIGFCVRGTLIVVGLTLIALMCVGLGVFYILWVFMPVVVLGLLITGVSYLYV